MILDNVGKFAIVMSNNINIFDDVIIGAGSLVRKSNNVKSIYLGSHATLKNRL